MGETEMLNEQAGWQCSSRRSLEGPYHIFLVGMKSLENLLFLQLNQRLIGIHFVFVESGRHSIIGQLPYQKKALSVTWN